MRSAILVISLIATAVAEAPYHLPRPAVHAPAFSYHQQTPPLPPPPPPPLQPAVQFHPAPQPSHYYTPQQVFHPQHVSQPHHVHSGYNYPQPLQPQIQYQPQIQVQSHHQATVQAPPQIAYYAPPQPAPQPPPVNFPRPQQVYQQPSASYGLPQVQSPSIFAPQLPVEQVRPLPAFVSPQHPSPIAYYQQQQQRQQSSAHGYSYQQPQISPNTFISQLPLQSQSLSNVPFSSLSSYQADSNQYNTPAQSQTHSEVLDSTVVNQVQNIIKESEHTSARDAGFLSLVSGVSLGNAKPSIEISSFVQNSPLQTRQAGPTSISSSSSSLSSSAASSNVSGSNGLPSISANSHSSSGTASFLPHTQPGTSYGAPN